MLKRARKLRLAVCLVWLGLCCAGMRAQQSARPVSGACTVNTAQGVKAEGTPAPGTLSGLKLTVTGRDGRPLQRKRFFLLERNIEEAGGAAWADVPRREQFWTGASPQLRDWLRRHDCDTLYCPEYAAEFESAVASVPEFKRAYEEGLRKYRSRQLALRWLTVNFPLKEARTQFYERKRAWLERAAQAGGKVASVMTDEKGVAYFTGLRLADYYLTNLMPLEDGDVLWNCKVTVPPPIPRQLYSVAVEFSYPKR